MLASSITITVMNSHGDHKTTPLPPGLTEGPPESVRFARLTIGQNVIQGNDVPDEA
jgi:hypothetical protein